MGDPLHASAGVSCVAPVTCLSFLSGARGVAVTPEGRGFVRINFSQCLISCIAILNQ